LSPAQTNNSRDTLSKIIRTKWNGGMAQAVAHLFFKHVALSSNSGTTIKKKQQPTTIITDFHSPFSIVDKS
jgi:hypothetical protein